MESKGGLGLGSIIVIGILVWFFFIRVDYSDYWYDGDGYAYVTYCGENYDYDCNAHVTNYLPVTHIEKSKSAFDSNTTVHTWEINFNNGGYVEIEGSCYEASESRGFDRVCYGYAYDEYGKPSKYELHN